MRTRTTRSEVPVSAPGDEFPPRARQFLNAQIRKWFALKLFELVENGPGCLGAVKRIEMNSWRTVHQKLPALSSRMFDATAFDSNWIILNRLNLLEQRCRNARTTHL